MLLISLKERYMKKFKEFLKEFHEIKKPKKKIYDILKKEPSEKKDRIGQTQYKGIKQELLNHIHRENLYRMKDLMRRFELPDDLKNEFNSKMVPINELPEEENKKYAEELAALYSIFKKYIELKKTITHKEETDELKRYPIGTIKNLISQGKSLGEIADYFKIPKSTLSYKIGELYQTSYSKLKKQMNK